MGRASSNKKVARAAGTGGGRATVKRRPWNYYGVVALVVVLGVAGTAVSRHTRDDQIAGAGNVPPLVGGTPWHEALSVDICGKVQPNITTTKDPVGITTTGNGIIQIHPFVKSAAGANATLGKFATSIGMVLNAAELQLPGGHAYHQGDSCGGVPSRIYVKQYGFAGSTVGTFANVDPDQVKLADGALVTIAFVPPAQKPLIGPPSAAIQAALKAAEASASSTSTTASAAPGVTAPAGTSTTTKGPATGSSSTAGSPTTTKGASTATTTPAASSPTTAPSS